MKALEKDRTRRYDSPTALAGDIRRHLQHQPVTASPPTAIYRMGKFVRRHKVGVVSAAAVAAFLVGFAVRERMQWQRVATERDRANREAQTAEKVSDFLVGLFDVSDPSRTKGETITVREILNAGSERVERELAGEPEIQARMMRTMGRVYYNLGLFTQAEALYVSALEIQKRHAGEDDPDTLLIMGDLAVSLKQQSKLPEAERLYRTTLEAQRRILGDDHENTVTTTNNLSLLLHDQGKLDEAVQLARETLEARRRLHGTEHPMTVQSMRNLAFILTTAEELDEAEQLLLDAMELTKRIDGEDSLGALGAMNTYAALLVERGKLDEAEPIRRELIDRQKRILGETHPSTMTSINNLAFLLKRSGRLEESEALFQEVADKNAETLGPGHRHTLMTMSSLGQVQRVLGKTAEAEQTLVRALDAYRSSGVEDDILYGVLEREYGVSLVVSHP